jgi:hypothetical protein
MSTRKGSPDLRNNKHGAARCPACAEIGHDQTRNHLIIQADGRFGCVVYPGDSPNARAQRKRIFALCGSREIKRLAVRPARLGRLGVSEDHSAEPSLKGGLLGRLGRLFQTHLGTEPAIANENRITEELSDFVRPLESIAETQPKLQPALLRLSAMISQWFTLRPDVPTQALQNSVVSLMYTLRGLRSPSILAASYIDAPKGFRFPNAE